MRIKSLISRTRMLCVLLTWAGIASVQAGAREQFETFTRDLNGLDGQFRQQVFDDTGHLRESVSGRVALSVPGLLRWETNAPYPQLIVADGRTLWVFDPDLEQVTRRPQGRAEEDSPLTLLTDPARLHRDYRIEEVSLDDDLDWLELRPRQGGDDRGFVSAQLGFNQDGLARMDIIDALGQEIVMTFSHWIRNPVFAIDTFHFTPPEGVDVVGGDD